jgi:hypothetical protein
LDAGKISDQTLDIEEELYACFMEWQKAFDRVNWTKLMQILKENWYRLVEKQSDQQIVHGSEC